MSENFNSDTPPFSMEEFFMSVIISSFVISLISLVVSLFLVDTTVGKKKLIDFGTQFVTAVLMLIAGVVYIVSAERVEKLKRSSHIGSTELHSNSKLV